MAFSGVFEVKKAGLIVDKICPKIAQNLNTKKNRSPTLPFAAALRSNFLSCAFFEILVSEKFADPRLFACLIFGLNSFGLARLAEFVRKMVECGKWK